MILFELQLIIAFVLDLLVGDPRWLPHPVKLIGSLASRLEWATRSLLPNEQLAGILTTSMVIVITAGMVYFVIDIAAQLHPLGDDVMSILLIYTSISTRDLIKHAEIVRKKLVIKDLPAARIAAAMMVGRDTTQLDDDSVTRATIESVAENLVDGITAPLLYACAGGPLLALTYKSINTLDSMFGYRNERYLRFGWAAARTDDFVNWLPARLTAPFVVAGALILGLHPFDSFRILIRDRFRHASPNSGFPEAAFAGALGVRLGGTNVYSGKSSDRPFIGDVSGVDTAGSSPGDKSPGGFRSVHIVQANRLMLVSAIMFLTSALGIRVLIQYFLEYTGWLTGW